MPHALAPTQPPRVLRVVFILALASSSFALGCAGTHGRAAPESAGGEALSCAGDPEPSQEVAEESTAARVPSSSAPCAPAESATEYEADGEGGAAPAGAPASATDAFLDAEEVRGERSSGSAASLYQELRERSDTLDALATSSALSAAECGAAAEHVNRICALAERICALDDATADAPAARCPDARRRCGDARTSWVDACE